MMLALVNKGGLPKKLCNVEAGAGAAGARMQAEDAASRRQRRPRNVLVLHIFGASFQAVSLKYPVFASTM